MEKTKSRKKKFPTSGTIRDDYVFEMGRMFNNKSLVNLSTILHVTKRFLNWWIILLQFGVKKESNSFSQDTEFSWV